VNQYVNESITKNWIGFYNSFFYSTLMWHERQRGLRIRFLSIRAKTSKNSCRGYWDW
jgi:hypothetical protein